MKNEPKNISPLSKNISEELNYDFLREEGISLAQKYSGSKWTDYNYHDPGVTILEQLCYALTDLGYRANFRIEDLLQINPDHSSVLNSNLLIPLAESLPSNPITITDFRVSVLDRVSSLKNIWFKKISGSKGLSGLFNVFIQLDEEVNPDTSFEIIDEIRNVLMETRPLNVDYEDFILLDKENIEISGDIEINPFYIAEEVLADIYIKIEELLNPSLNYLDTEQIIKKGYSEFEIYSGVKTNFGFIEKKELISKTNSLYKREIIELIESVDGVNRIKKLNILKNGVIIHDDIIIFNENAYPFFIKKTFEYFTSNERINLYKDNSICSVDSIILSQLYDSKSIKNKRTYKQENKNLLSLNEGRFSKKEISKYFSIQNEFPSIYGLKKNELPVNASKDRISRVKQLKAYLYFFEQIMANFLAKLSNLNEIFSIENNDISNLEIQFPMNISDINEILDESKNISLNPNHKKYYLEKKHKILDHLLSRFNQFFETEILRKISNEKDLIKLEEDLLNKKIKYASEIIKLGKIASKGLNYKSKTINLDDATGIENRLRLILDLKNNKNYSLTKMFSNNIENIKKNDEWVIRNLKLKRGQITVMSLFENSYKLKEIKYYCNNYSEFKSILNYGKLRKNYKVILSSNNIYSTLFRCPGLEFPIRIYKSKDEKKCLKAIDSSIEKINEFNASSSGLYVVEHLLLRSVKKLEYSLLINKNNESIMESSERGDFLKIKNIKSDILNLVKNKQNFLVSKKGSSSKFYVALNSNENEILKSSKTFKTKIKAQEFIDQTYEYFKDMLNSKIEIENNLVVSISNKYSNSFPENFNYSNSVSIIFPDWTSNFQNIEFKNFVKRNIEYYLPANQNYDLYFLTLNEMKVFEKTYQEWLKYKYINSNKLDSKSIEIIQILNSYKRYNG